MHDIRFSVITPVYNREQNIGHVIDSVLAQTYGNWELILIDDGSTDRTGAICREYAERDSRIRCICQANSGVSAARNAGILQAAGEYIVFLDSDNSLRPNMLDVLAARIAHAPLADMLCFGYGSGQSTPPSRDAAPVILSRETIRSRYLPTHINIYPQNEHFLKNYIWNKCYKHHFLSENRILFDPNRRTWEDGQFVVNCLSHADSILLMDDVLYNTDCDIETDHLSAHFFPDQLSHYLEDETDYKQRFENEFDFSSPHYCRSNFSVMQLLFSRAVQACGKEAVPLIEQSLQFDILHFWIERIQPDDAFEARIIRLIKGRKARAICFLFQSSPAARITRKMLRTIRK